MVAPRRIRGAVEALLVELGHRVLDHLDEEREALAEAHDELFDEIAAFARRGWAFAFDAETGMGYDPADYDELLANILAAAGIQRVDLDDDRALLEVDGREYPVQRPTQEADWFDVGWIFDVVSYVLADRGWQLLTLDDDDEHAVIVGVVPATVWAALGARGLTGAWQAVEPFDPATNAAFRSPLAPPPRRQSSRRLMN